MPADATWFGPPDRPLAGWLHVPEREVARGGVVICPPLGLEYVASHRALRSVAERLAEHGFVVLRFDYDGTGASAGGPEDPHRVSSWLASIGAADAEIRAVVGGAPVAHLGLRMGATLAAARLAQHEDHQPVAALVMWDACRSGRRFIRQQRALGQLENGLDLGDGSVDAPGFRFSAEAVSDTSSIDLARSLDVRVPHLLVLARADDDAGRVLPHLPACRENVDGMPNLLDVPSPRAQVPDNAIERMVAWMHATMPAVAVPFTPCWYTDADPASNVHERHVRLGPTGLTGIEAGPTGGPDRGRSVLLLNNAAESNIGPVRLWTDLARSWAALGIRSVRFDLSGIGDSPTRSGEPEDLLYSPHAEQDVLDVVATGVVGRSPVLVGLCSGAHLALRMGARIPTASVVAINIESTRPVHPFRTGPDVVFGAQLRWPRRVLARLGLLDAARRLRVRADAVKFAIPSLIWLVLSRFSLRASPGKGLRQVHDTDVTLICCPDDAAGYLTWGRWELERARRHGLEFILLPDIDHVPMPYHQRQAVKRVLTEQVLRRVPA